MPQGWQTWQNYIRKGTRAGQPFGQQIPLGAIYCVNDEDNILERWTGTAWEAYSPTANITYLGRKTARTTSTTVLAVLVAAIDCTYILSANVNVTTAPTQNSFSVTCSYTDETNLARILTLQFAQPSGSALVSVITKQSGAGPYAGLSFQIRAKAGSTIVVATTGTFTGVVYNVESAVRRIK